jgi:hypothetical protein
MAGHIDQFDYNGKTISAPPFRRKKPKIHEEIQLQKKEN